MAGDTQAIVYRLSRIGIGYSDTSVSRRGRGRAFSCPFHAGDRQGLFCNNQCTLLGYLDVVSSYRPGNDHKYGHHSQQHDQDYTDTACPLEPQCSNIRYFVINYLLTLCVLIKVRIPPVINMNIGSSTPSITHQQ